MLLWMPHFDVYPSIFYQLFTMHACATGVLSDTYTTVFQKATAGAQQLNPSRVVSDCDSALECRHRQLSKRATQRLSLSLLPGIGIFGNSLQYIHYNSFSSLQFISIALFKQRYSCVVRPKCLIQIVDEVSRQFGTGAKVSCCRNAVLCGNEVNVTRYST